MQTEHFGFRTDSIMRVLILYSISTGMLTSIVALIGGTIVSLVASSFMPLLNDIQYLIKPSSHAWNVPLVLLPHCAHF
jgi:ABC-type lipoprotein release transport system permease subunit